VQGAVSHLLEVDDLKVIFKLDEGLLQAVNGVNLSVARGKTLGLVGESGCGKSVAVQAVMRITPSPGVVAGQILLQIVRGGQPRTVDLAKLSATGREIRSIRGKDIAMIFQEPMTSFSPLYTIGNQIMEAILLHKTTNQKEARQIAVAMLDKVGISNPAQRIDEYPHQLSGGMRQRALIAAAISCRPSLLIADEPTTALDVTIQAEILDLLREMRAQFGLALLLITHDLGVVAHLADRVAIMYAGRIVEEGPTATVLSQPAHPYTRGLLRSLPGSAPGTRLRAIPGAVPDLSALPAGCAFSPRCGDREARCDQRPPEPTALDPDHHTRCYLHTKAG